MSGTTEREEMIASLLHKCITATSTYVKGCEENIVNQLSSSVKALIKQVEDDSGSARTFTEENRLASDCLMSLVSVLGDCDSMLGSTILSLLNVIGVESCAAVLLYSLGAIDTLVNLVEAHYAHPILVMKALARISKHVKFTGHEQFMDTLLQHVVNNIMANDASLKPSLCVLVNLASGCLPIQMQLRSMDRGATLRKAFIRLVGHDENEITVVALAAMMSTGMSEEFNKLIQSDKNLNQILKLSFSIILSLTSSEAFSYVIDVLVYLLRVKRVQQFLASSCPELESFISKSACLLTRCGESQLVKLFELLLALASVPVIRLMITSLVFAPVSTPNGDEEELLQHIFFLAKRSVSVDSGASVLALKLITYIYEGLTVDPSQAGSTCHMNFQFLTECLSQNELSSKRTSVKMASAEKILASLCLLEVLITSEAFSSIVLSEIEPATITDVIQFQLQSNPIAFNWNNKPVSPEGGSNPPPEWRVGVEIVLRAMSIIIEATERNTSYSTCLNDYMQKASLLPFIATGLSSSLTDHIQLCLKLINKSSTLGHLQTTVLSDVLSSINNRKSASCVQPPTSSGFQLQSQPFHLDDKENIIASSPCTSPRSERVVLSSQGNHMDIAEKLSGLQVSGDSHISDIISVYEQKLKAQKTKETHLDDLVQAKTMALSQADRLINQYKARLAQVDSETHKLRSIVHESERRSEGYRDKMNEMLVDRERIHAEMERLLQDSRRLEDTQRALSSVKRELDTLTEIHTTLTNFTDNLKQQHRELESEYSLLKESERKKSISITEKDSKIAELRKVNKKLEDQIKKLTTEKTNLGEQRDSLQVENKRLEKTLKQKEEKLRVIFDTLK